MAVPGPQPQLGMSHLSQDQRLWVASYLRAAAARLEDRLVFTEFDISITIDSQPPQSKMELTAAWNPEDTRKDSDT